MASGRIGEPGAGRSDHGGLALIYVDRIYVDDDYQLNRPGELVLDLGAGEGALTAHLVRAGARVVAVELHPRAGILSGLADSPADYFP